MKANRIILGLADLLMEYLMGHHWGFVCLFSFSASTMLGGLGITAFLFHNWHPPLIWFVSLPFFLCAAWAILVQSCNLVDRITYGKIPWLTWRYQISAVIDGRDPWDPPAQANG